MRRTRGSTRSAVRVSPRRPQGDGDGATRIGGGEPTGERHGRERQDVALLVERDE